MKEIEVISFTYHIISNFIICIVLEFKVENGAENILKNNGCCGSKSYENILLLDCWILLYPEQDKHKTTAEPHGNQTPKNQLSNCFKCRIMEAEMNIDLLSETA